eukprot:scaffold549_cov385-Prasinococcus_capsulatus_cf.AAC.10
MPRHAPLVTGARARGDVWRARTSLNAQEQPIASCASSVATCRSSPRAHDHTRNAPSLHDAPTKPPKGCSFAYRRARPFRFTRGRHGSGARRCVARAREPRLAASPRRGTPAATARGRGCRPREPRQVCLPPTCGPLWWLYRCPTGRARPSCTSAAARREKRGALAQLGAQASGNEKLIHARTSLLGSPCKNSQAYTSSGRHNLALRSPEAVARRRSSSPTPPVARAGAHDTLRTKMAGTAAAAQSLPRRPPPLYVLHPWEVRHIPQHRVGVSAQCISR